MEADYDDDFEADVVEATVPTATEVHTSAEDAPPAAGADARGLQQRLAAARAEKGALAERRKVLLQRRRQRAAAAAHVPDAARPS